MPEWPQLISYKQMLTVGGHANSLLQGLQMSGQGSPQNHMMTAVRVNQTIKLRKMMRTYNAQTMKNISQRLPANACADVIRCDTH